MMMSREFERGPFYWLRADPRSLFNEILRGCFLSWFYPAGAESGRRPEPSRSRVNLGAPIVGSRSQIDKK